MFAKLFTVILTMCFASFTNLCAYRLGKGNSPWSPPRSYCPSCHHPLCWWQLVPISGFIIQGGHCHFCHQRIPAYDTVCELSCGIFAYLLATPSLFHSFLVIIIIQFLLFICSCDYYYQCLYPLSLIGLLPLPLLIPNWSPPTTLTWLAIVIVTVLLTVMAVSLHWLGGGDVMFIAILLFTFGIEYTVSVILGACLVTLPFFIYHRQSQLPFLPALCLSTIIVLVFICA
ncbi:MAG: prepilin peptidase [Lactobacillaceae bacterium]|nr:prepilin peptidase [Lactobacillaceae bacterium]